MKKIKTTDKSIPCLICEKSVEIDPHCTLADIAKAPFYGGIECRSRGNYGSQILDMGGQIFFILCDECVIRHSHKMLMDDHKLENARDYYERWFARVKETKVGDSYLEAVSPYFEV